MSKEANSLPLEVVALMLIVAAFYFWFGEDYSKYESVPPTPPESLYQPKNVMWRR